jgi:hypothetical protein
MNKIIKSITKYFVIIIFCGSILLLAGLLFSENLDTNFYTKSFTIYAITSSVCGTIIYFAQQTNGITAGKETQDYKNNLDAYHTGRMGKSYGDTGKFLSKLRQDAKDEFIRGTVAITGVSENHLSEITLLSLKQDSRFDRFQKKRIRALLKDKIPFDYPQSPAAIFGLTSGSGQKGFGLDPLARRKVLISKSISRVITTIILMYLSGSVIVQFGTVDPLAAALKLTFSLISLSLGLYSGYMSGYGATAVTEKDTLGNAARFFAEMDKWLESKNKSE